MGSLSFKASIRKLWNMLGWRKGSAKKEAVFRERGAAVASTELSNFEAGGAMVYTSLKDLMPARRCRTWNSLPLSQHQFLFYGERPPIRNNLVEQAARAYVQAAEVKQDPPTQFLHRLWMKLTAGPSPRPLPASTAAPAPSVGLRGLLPSWMSFNFTPGLSWIFRQLRPQSTTVLLRE